MTNPSIQNIPIRTERGRAIRHAFIAPKGSTLLQQGLAARPDSAETAKTIRVPTFVLAGGEDQSSTTADMMALAFLSPTPPILSSPYPTSSRVLLVL